MDGKKFDDLTQALASGASRRGVIRLLGGGLAAGMAASLGINRTAHAKGNSQCSALCNSIFPPGKERGQCISQGAQGQGPCADLCLGIDCSSDDSDCTVGVCNGGTCSSSPINEGGTCTTVDSQAGTCSEGICVPGVDPCGDCPPFSSLEPACYWLSDGFNETKADCWYLYQAVFDRLFNEAQCTERNTNCGSGGGCYKWATESC